MINLELILNEMSPEAFGQNVFQMFSAQKDKFQDKLPRNLSLSLPHAHMFYLPLPGTNTNMWVGSVTRLGDFLDFGPLFKAFSNNQFVQISHIPRQFL